MSRGDHKTHSFSQNFLFPLFMNPEQPERMLLCLLLISFFSSLFRSLSQTSPAGLAFGSSLLPRTCIHFRKKTNKSFWHDMHMSRKIFRHLLFGVRRRQRCHSVTFLCASRRKKKQRKLLNPLKTTINFHFNGTVSERERRKCAWDE